MTLHPSVKRRGARAFFASANTSDGFYSLYGEAYSEEKLNSLYILKGGPGTGKSTLLDRLAERAEKDGYDYELILCSSDPGSLDGIAIDKLGVAVLDGTAPHARDPFYPGVCGEIVNLGEMWDADKLHGRRDDIEKLFAEKSEAYSRAYRLLSAAGVAERDVIRAYSRAAEDDKMNAAVKRLLRQLAGRGGGGVTERRFVTAHSVKGKVKVDTVERIANVTVTVSRSHGFGYLYMRSLCEAAGAMGLSMVSMPDALLPEYCEAVFLPDERVLIKLADEEIYENGDIRVNCGRFIRTDVIRNERAKLRFSEKICASLVDEALASLGCAGDIHGRIEEIYKSAMNFDGVDEAERMLEAKIFG